MSTFLLSSLLVAVSLLPLACSPKDNVELPSDRDGLASSGLLVDGGSIQNVEDVPIDTGADVDPDKLKSHQSCAQVLQCAGELCKVSPGKGCDAPCVQDASEAAAGAYAAYGSCRNDHCVPACAGSEAPGCVDTCLLQRCGTLLFRCNLEGKTGAAPCSKMVACHKSCADAAKANEKQGKPGGQYACLNACYGGLSGGAQDLYDKWASCFAHSTAADRYAACLPELLVCGADGHGPAPGEPGKTCLEIATCAATCAQQTGKAHDYQGCIGACFGEGGVLGKARWVGHLRCLSDLAEGEADASKCAATLGACAQPTGTQSCQEVRACADKCLASGGAACHLACMAQADDAGAVQYGALRWCGLGHCEAKCGGKAACRAACLGDACAPELAACAGP